MFSFHKKRPPEPVEAPEPISPRDKADVVINGSMSGVVQGPCDVYVDVNGQCAGSFTVREINIHGTVVGDVCADELIIHPTGQLFYKNLSVKNTIVHDGGVYTDDTSGCSKDLLKLLEVPDTAPVSSSKPILLTQEKVPAQEKPPLEKESKPKVKTPTFINTY